VAAVVVVELAVGLLVPRRSPLDWGARVHLAGMRPTFTQSVLQWQVERIGRLRRPADVVVIGDSTGLMALVPRELERELGEGVRVENLCTIVPLGIAGHVDVLEHTLAVRPPPRVVAYAFTGESLAMDDEAVASAGLRAGLRDWLGMDDAAWTAWPSSRLRGAVRGGLARLLSVPDANDAGVRDFLRAHHGYLRENNPIPLEPDGLAPPGPISRDALDGLGRLVELTGRIGARLVVLRTPLPDLLDTPAHRQALAHNERQWESLVSGFPHVTLVRPFGGFVPARYFLRYEHLSLEGALRRTREVAPVLRRALGNGAR